MSKKKKETTPVEAKMEKPPVPKEENLRKILLETDGNMVRVTVNETSGNLELVAALQAVLTLIANGR